LEAPWALAFDSRGTLYLTERPGRLRVIRSNRLQPKPLATFDVAAVGDAGLLGMAVDPSRDQKLPPPDDIRTPVECGNLRYSNPWRQIVHPRWAGGTVVWSIPCGPVAVDPSRSHDADEYIVVYSLDGDKGEPEKVDGQYAIYDTKPGDPGYSPLWRHNHVIVPRVYTPQQLRSKEDVAGVTSLDRI
jgi:hypothetical protein